MYLLEEEQVPISWTTGLSAFYDDVPEDKRPEVLETLYRHGWEINQRFGLRRYTLPLGKAYASLLISFSTWYAD